VFEGVGVALLRTSGTLGHSAVRGDGGDVNIYYILHNNIKYCKGEIVFAL